MTQETQTSQEISLIEIFYELKKKKYILLLFIVIALVCVSAYKIFSPKKYSYETSFITYQDNAKATRSLLGNSSILKNDNLYVDINIPEANSGNLFKEISPNSYEDILNSDSALYYFSNLVLPNQTISILDSLQQLKEKLDTDIENNDITLIKKYLGKKPFITKYNNEKNIVYITVTTNNKNLSKWLSLLSIEYITQYIQRAQNKRIQEQLNAIDKIIDNNATSTTITDKKDTNNVLPLSINKILKKQLYEYKLQIALSNNSPFSFIATNVISPKLSTSMLYIIAILIGGVVGGLWVFAQKMWIDANKDLKK